ncbi:hypothetical protein AWC38_SpisGene9965 [Stylophora pistillata]|uniref:Uncharacterized protein n=1 Tax=Stylophora pistillata TaxID=50429 RepID=A0A2B4S7S1_STYPI|nr:hypothetical protein AWC38_SpisGene9965 [Stylophora pistillata]
MADNGSEKDTNKPWTTSKESDREPKDIAKGRYGLPEKATVTVGVTKERMPFGKKDGLSYSSSSKCTIS